MARFWNKAKVKANAQADPETYYTGYEDGSLYGEGKASELLLNLRDKHQKAVLQDSLAGKKRNIWDQTAIAWTAEHGPQLKTWAAVEQSLSMLRYWSCLAFRRDMLAEDPTSKVGAAFLVRPDGSAKAVFGFTAPAWPGDSSEPARKDRVSLIDHLLKAHGASAPSFTKTENIVPGSCVETWAFPRLLDTESSNSSGVMTTTTWALAHGKPKQLCKCKGHENEHCKCKKPGLALPLCENCQLLAKALHTAFPSLQIVDAAIETES